MSYFDYKASQQLEIDDVPFYALIMAAMRRADNDNLELLKRAFPQTWKELLTRYKAPGGLLPNESPEQAP